MGIMSNTVSIYQYQVQGDPPAGDLAAWVGRQLHQRRFEPIDEVPDETSVGWVRQDDATNADFTDERAFRHDHFLAFSLRRDQRKVPAALLKNMVSQECEQWLAARPALKRVPVMRRVEIRENIHAALLARTLPTPSTVDILWNTLTKVVTVANISTKTLELVEEEFSGTFEGLRLVPIHPVSRAQLVLDEELHPALMRANQASSKDVLSQIRENRWVGWDFLLWLVYRSSKGVSTYTVDQEGPLEKGERFAAFLYDRFVLVEEREEGIRKSSIIGPQKDFSEARQAILDGKNIVEGVLYFERGDFRWKMVLKADIFAFGSFACPAVTIERDEITDPALEKEAVFFERMSLMETGLQLFDSLYACFLKERLDGDWPETQAKIRAWLSSQP